MAGRILVIKLGALGDFVQALGPFEAIRRHHAGAAIALLTTAPFRPLAEASGWFEEVWLDDRPSIWQVGAWLALRRRLAAARFERVYDLQTSDRSAAYFRLMTGVRSEWSGIAAGCSHPHRNPDRDRMHTIDRQADQLADADVPAGRPPTLDWLDADVSRFDLRPRFAVLAPGGAAHRPEKRWPAEHFGGLARHLAEQGVQPVVVGSGGDENAANAIVQLCSETVNLVGRTSLMELAGLARRAVGAVGNDTGPMHIVAAVGCPSVVLFSDASDPALCGQRGAAVGILQRPVLADLPVSEVEGALRLR